MLKPTWGIILLALVVAMIAIEVFSNRTMKRLGIEPAPAARWLRPLVIVVGILVTAVALWILLKA